METKSFLFDIGETVIYKFKDHHREGKIIKRKRQKDYFLSDACGYTVFTNIYTVEEKFESLRGRKIKKRYNDPEFLLTSADISFPKGTVDYESDEYTGCFVNKNGIILKTIKSGKRGFANDLVRDSINQNVNNKLNSI